MEKVAQKNMSTQGWVIVALLAIILFFGLALGVGESAHFFTHFFICFW